MTTNTQLPGQQCCGAPHPFDAVRVEERWLPQRLDCLIIGESPGAPGSDYFYDTIPAGRDPIAVRRALLGALHDAALIASPTLEAFRDRGFLFDHAIRCQLPMGEIDEERKRAARFESDFAERFEHLRPLIVRNAIAHLYPAVRRERRTLMPPYCLADMPQVVVSRYFNRFHTRESARELAVAVRPFLLSGGPAK